MDATDHDQHGREVPLLLACDSRVVAGCLTHVFLSADNISLGAVVRLAVFGVVKA
jgi:hypothetical protein